MPAIELPRVKEVREALTTRHKLTVRTPDAKPEYVNPNVMSISSGQKGVTVAEAEGILEKHGWHGKFDGRFIHVGDAGPVEKEEDAVFTIHFSNEEKPHVLLVKTNLSLVRLLEEEIRRQDLIQTVAKMFGRST